MRHKRNRTVIRIVNPLPGGSHYTSERNARRFVERGIAAYGIGGKSIEMVRGQHLSVTDHREMASELLRLADDQLIEIGRKGIVFWNGSRGHNKAYPPFCNVQMLRPTDLVNLAA